MQYNRKDINISPNTESYVFKVTGTKRHFKYCINFKKCVNFYILIKEVSLSTLSNHFGSVFLEWNSKNVSSSHSLLKLYETLACVLKWTSPWGQVLEKSVSVILSEDFSLPRCLQSNLLCSNSELWCQN